MCSRLAERAGVTIQYVQVLSCQYVQVYDLCLSASCPETILQVFIFYIPVRSVLDCYW